MAHVVDGRRGCQQLQAVQHRFVDAVASQQHTNATLEYIIQQWFGMCGVHATRVPPENMRLIFAYVVGPLNISWNSYPVLRSWHTDPLMPYDMNHSLQREFPDVFAFDAAEDRLRVQVLHGLLRTVC